MHRLARHSALLLLTTRLFAQTPTIRVDTREVDVDVTVVDAKGAPVLDLTRDDFTILDDGKPRAIESYSVVRDFPPISALPSTSPLHLPVSVPAGPVTPAEGASHSTAILLDQVNAFFEDAASARGKVLSLMAKLPPDERVAIYVIARRQDLVLLHDYTTDHELLRKTLAEWTPVGMNPEQLSTFPYTQDAARNYYVPGLPPPIVPPQSATSSPPGGAAPAFDPSSELDLMWRQNSEQARTSFQKLAEQLAQVPGRKTLFWITQTFPATYMTGINKFGWDKTITALNRANVAVNVVDTRGLLTCPPAACAVNDPTRGTFTTMRQVAERTGGKAWIGRNDMDDAILEGIVASRAVYSLRFTLRDAERDNRFHSIKVKVARPGVDLFYRQGYSSETSGASAPSTDLVAGKIEGKDLEVRVAASSTVPLDAAVQLPWFYAGTNRATVHLALEMTPTGMTFEKSLSGLRGRFQIVGIAVRPDGREAARFAEAIDIDVEDQQHADAFIRTPWRYRHDFQLAAGMYTLNLSVGLGQAAPTTKSIPMTIASWKPSDAAISAIAFSAETSGVTGTRNALVAGGKQFLVSPSARFHASDRVYFYAEIYAPSPETVSLQVRVLDRETAAVKSNTGPVSVANYVVPGSTSIPFATALPISQLARGAYTLELTASQAASPETQVRAANFDIF